MNDDFLQSLEREVVVLLGRGPLSEVQISMHFLVELDQVLQVLRELEDKGVVCKTVDSPADPPIEGHNLQVWAIAA